MSFWVTPCLRRKESPSSLYPFIRQENSPAFTNNPLVYLDPLSSIEHFLGETLNLLGYYKPSNKSPSVIEHFFEHLHANIRNPKKRSHLFL